MEFTNREAAISALCRIGDRMEDGLIREEVAAVVGFLRKQKAWVQHVVFLSADEGKTWQMVKRGTKDECDDYVREFPGAGELVVTEYRASFTHYYDREVRREGL